MNLFQVKAKVLRNNVYIYTLGTLTPTPIFLSYENPKDTLKIGLTLFWFDRPYYIICTRSRLWNEFELLWVPVYHGLFTHRPTYTYFMKWKFVKKFWLKNYMLWSRPVQRANSVKHTRSTSSEIDHEFIVLEMWNSLTKEIYSVYVYNIYFIMNWV